MDDRSLRILRGQRAHQVVASAPWWIQRYPPLVWLPFVVAYAQPLAIDLDASRRHVGLAVAAASDVFEDHRIAAEEKVLRDAFGERCLRYAERGPALIPFPA